MTVAQFEAICETYGDQNLPSGERWKSLRRICIGNNVINFYVEIVNFIRTDDVDYSDNCLVISGTNNVNDEILNKYHTIKTIYPLSSIRAMSFIQESSPTPPPPHKEKYIVFGGHANFEEVEYIIRGLKANESEVEELWIIDGEHSRETD